MGDNNVSSQFAQVIQSAVNNAMQSMGSNGPGGRSMNIEMSVQIGPNGQMIAQNSRTSSTDSPAAAATASSTVPGASALVSSSSQQQQQRTESTESNSNSTQQRSTATTGNNRQPLQHPPLSSMADAMDELGMVSYKMLIISHTHFNQKFHQKLTFFTKKIQQPLMVVVHILN